MIRPLAAAFLSLAMAVPAQAAKLKTLYDFTASGQTDGSYPNGHLAVDAQGDILGLTVSGGAHGYGTVFALMPPAAPGGNWRFKALHQFTAGEGSPGIFAGLSIAANGTIYGVSAGAVFTLSPLDAKGRTTYTRVLSFKSTLGHTIQPTSSLAFGPDAFYVTDAYGGTQRQGVVYRIAHGDDSWTVTDIHDFKRTDGWFPKGDLVIGVGGDIIGTTQAGGAGAGNIYRLLPPSQGGGPWATWVLFNFSARGPNLPVSGLARAADGTIFGVTGQTGFSPSGTLFTLAQPIGQWGITSLVTARRLYPGNGVLPLADGSVLTAQGNLVMRAAPSDAGWTLTSLARATDTATFGTPVAGPGGTVYLSSEYGPESPNGRIYQLTP